SRCNTATISARTTSSASKTSTGGWRCESPRLQLEQLIAQQRRPLEVERLGGLRHLGLEDLHHFLAVDLVGVGRGALGNLRQVRRGAGVGHAGAELDLLDA